MYMKSTILNYPVIIEPDIRTGSNKICYSALCPALDIADDGDTVEEAIANIKKTIEFHLECLVEEGKEIPSPTSSQGFLTNVQVSVPANYA